MDYGFWYAEAAWCLVVRRCRSGGGVPMIVLWTILLTVSSLGTKLKHMARKETTGMLLALWALLVLPALLAVVRDRSS